MTYWQQKVICITGGSTGFGRELAGVFSERGARVILVARDEGRISDAVSSLRRGGADATGIAADVTRQEDIDTLFARIADDFGGLDAMVNCAGRSSRGEALTTKPEDFRDLLEINFLATVRCSQAAAPLLVASGGHLVNIGSLASKTASPFLGAYPASKFPVAAFSQQLRMELNPEGVHVLLVCPGPIARPDAGARYDQQASDLPESARKPGGGVKVKGIPPARLTHKILHYCQRRKPELVMPGKARLLFAISQLSPRLGDWIIRKMT